MKIVNKPEIKQVSTESLTNVLQNIKFVCKNFTNFLKIKLHTFLVNKLISESVEQFVKISTHCVYQPKSIFDIKVPDNHDPII